ncbi:MAG: glutamine--fructose-6-phosphate transaminase (isomerizing) [Bacilli bacterium]|nr:glutamine--fructose-6-phosphate transaminase (isomerizing) [Bacilli bacterium]
MCGIVGYLGKKEKTISVLIEGLKALEYRGYDSAGIAYQKENKIKITKSVGRLQNLEQKIKIENTVLGIGHTRWATHGKPSTTNSHPHQVGSITLVHNGIIENYIELKQFLEKHNYQFQTETDTEVATALIDYCYQETKNMISALKRAQKELKGSYAFAILNNEEPNILYAMKKESPLILGKTKEELFLASDPMAICAYTNNICYLKEGSILKLEPKKITLIEENETIPIWVTLDMEQTKCSKNGYDHYMLKEIYEQPDVIYNTVMPYLENNLENLHKMPNFNQYEKIQIVACGSAYHTGLVGKWMLEGVGNIPVEVEIASEYRYKKVFYDKKTLVIVVSQSGETADTLASLRKANKDNIDTLAIVNVITSTIAREAKYVLPVKAGIEIAVATTKAYLAQLALFSLITLKLMIEKKLIENEELEELLAHYQKLPIKIKKLLKELNVKELASKTYKNEDIFFLGRGIDYAICTEASLKLKEISYIHSEAYAAGELKHGTISLISKKTPVFSLVTDKEISEKTISNIKEVKARGAYSIVITTGQLDEKSDYYDDKIVIPNTHFLLQPILNIIPFQLLAYEIAKLRNCDIDKPKNLAKSVTVE